ncbi:hypothetical protein [Streptomyces sp. SID3343]|uniref:hypothetical protein n=1 Tax=Streptomyces sp. SID3343 TaxID=2690260 RepID=UPI00136CB49B|nr:hypothetical protein [Streptomyces sp. SID3343]MYW05223.1 hypothetical protein [Streptomyces sp. SID3343]
MRMLRIAAGIEAVSVVALFGNLCTVPVPAITSLVGPLHGTAYLVVVAATRATRSTAPTAVRWRAAIPGIGGVLALRRLRAAAPAAPGSAAGRPSARTSDAGADDVPG